MSKMKMFLVALIAVPFISLADQVEKGKVTFSNDVTVAGALSVNTLAFGTNPPVAASTNVSGTNTGTIATFVKLDGSRPMTGGLTVPSLAVTDGSPTNGALWAGTNTTGGGKWTVYPAIYVKKANTQAITNAVPTLLTWPTTIAQIGGTWDGTKWTPGVVGTVQIVASLQWDATARTGWSILQLSKNGASYQTGPTIRISSDSYSTVQASFQFYNAQATNVYGISVNTSFGVTATNQPDISGCYFSGKVNP